MTDKAGRPKKIKYQKPRGMYDILAEDFQYLNKILRVCEKTARFYGFNRIETPILENAEIFIKGTGADTDIVGKEMYFIKGEKGKALALRPEGTPSIVRAYIEHGMGSAPKPIKLWHFGPFFRRERPQAGRFRQFWQFGFEVLSRDNSVIDAQIIQIFYGILKKLGIKGLIVHVNSIGCRKCRGRYIKSLVAFLKLYRASLCADCKRRTSTNPLRVLDCKKEKCQKVISGAPQILDSLCKKCRQHFKEVLELLDGLEIPYRLNPFLVRGLDYYTRTIFEIFTQKKDAEKESKIALVGGGRYDELVELLGGRPTPGCGAAAGIERIIDLIKKRDLKMQEAQKPRVFLAQLGFLAKTRALSLFEELCKANILVAEDFSRSSLRAQLVRANRLGIRYVLILGQKEVIDREIILRDMKKESQKNIKLNAIVKRLKKLLK